MNKSLNFTSDSFSQTAWTQRQVIENINQLLSDYVFDEFLTLDRNIDLRDDLWFDSLDFIDFQMKCEDLFAIRFSERETEKIKKLCDVYDICFKKLGLE